MRIHVERESHGEEQTKGRILRRILAVVTPAVLLCLFATWGVAAQVNTETTVSFSPGSVLVGQSVTVTWTVDAQTDSFTFAGGTLERSLWDPDGISLAPGNVTPVSGIDPFTSTYAFTANKPGDYIAGGTYTGCPTCTPVVNGSSATDATLTVSKRSTSTAVTGPATAVVGEPLTFTVDVLDTSVVGTPPSLAGDVVWTVTLPDTSTATLNGTVDLNGDGTISYSPPVTGSYTIEAAYQGNASYGTSASSPATFFTVGERATSLAVAGASTAVVAEPVDVTATVSDSSGKTGYPAFSGTVTWSSSNGVGSFNSPSCAVSPAGVCSVIYTPASGDIGKTVNITARYDDDSNDANDNDDPNYGISTGTHGVAVSQRTTSAAVTVPAGTLYVNEPLTFEVQVTDGQAGIGTSPSMAGNVTWTVTYTPTATGTPVTVTSSGETVNVNGYGEYAFIPPYASSELTVGYAITAEYAGNTDYVASNPDGSDTFTVAKRTTSAAITVPTAPLYVNESLTFSVQVSDDQVGTGTSPSLAGNVTWTVTYTPTTTHTLVTVTSSGATVNASGYGEYSFTPPTDYASSELDDDYEITVVYASNDYYVGSTSDTESFTVDERPTSMSVTGNATAYVNEVVTVTATVSDDSGASGSPDFTGTVTWAHSGNGSFNSASCTVSTGGVCSVTYTSAVADAGTTVIITARYDDDNDNANGNDDLNYGISDGSHDLLVSKRTTETQNLAHVSGTTYVYEALDFEVDVVDTSTAGGTPPSFDTGADVTWTVTLPDSSTTPLTGTATTNGVNCAITYTPSVPGTYGIVANYEGNASYAASDPDASLAFSVSKWPTTTAVSVPSPVYVQHPFNFDVSVTDSTNPGSPSHTLAGSVTATVTFDAGSGLETVVLNGAVDAAGAGTINYTPPHASAGLTTGYQVTVQYLGNTYYATSSYGPTAFTVDKRPTTATVPDPATPVYTYQPKTVTVHVATSVDPGTAPDFTGNVQWAATMFGGTFVPVSGAGTVNSAGDGAITFYGTHGDNSGYIGADYAGNAYFDTSGYGYNTNLITVVKRPTNTTITGPVPSGADHDFTLTVVDASGAAGTPPALGSLNWQAPYDAGGSAGSGTIASGGTITIVNPSGDYTLDVSYPADNVYATSSASQHVTGAGRATSTTISGPEDPVCLCQTVQLTATVIDESGSPVGPGFTGTVDWVTNGSGTLSCVSCDIPHGGQVVMGYTTHPNDVGSISFTASYSGDATYNASSSSAFTMEVIQRATRTDVYAQPGTVYVNETTSLSATMTDLATDCCGACATPPDSAVVTFSRKAGSPGTGTVNNTADTYTPTSASTDQETHIIRGQYPGNSTYEASSGEVGVDVKKREVAVQVEVGTASLSNPAGTFAPVSSVYIHELVFLRITVRDVTPAGHGSSPAYAFSGDTVVVDDLGRNGDFLASSHTFINADDLGSPSNPAQYRYFVPYIPKAGDAGTTTLAATYQGSSVYEMQPGATTLGVEARPTTVSVSCDPDPVFVDQRTKCTITVQDVGPTASSTVPTGAIHLTTSGDGHFYETDSSTTMITDKALVASDGGSVDVYYEAETASAAQVTHILSAHYVGGVVDGTPPDPDASTQVHADSSSNVALTVKLRKTTTTVSVSPATLKYRTTTMYSVITVEVEDVSPGDKSSPGGKLMLEAPGSGGHFNYYYSNPTYNSRTGNGTSLLTLRWNSFDSGLVELEARANYVLDEKTVPVHPILAVFEPTDGKHLASADGKQVEVEVDEDSYDDPPSQPAPGYGSDGVISCGLIGGTTATDIINFRTSLLAYADILKIMDMGATVLQLLPDVLVDVTDPAWSVIHLIFQGAMVDLDGDGIPGLFELGYVWAGLSDFNRDVDGDGFSDYGEIVMAGGQFYPTILDTSFSWSRPNPTHPDSDRDGISDGAENFTFLTNCCDPDTDDDGLLDGQELATSTAFDATGYESVALPSTSPRIDLRDQSDPFVADTDSDGLNDFLEFEPGSLSPPYSTFVNDPDSDGDGLIDGVEDSDFSGSTSYTLGGSNSEGSGETHPCIADTDGDGLTDGEEEGLFGRGNTEVSTPTGTITVPALDDDSDNDGLSDYEEQIVTGTDPLNWDTDGDGLSDADELIVIGGNFPNRSFRQESDPLDPDTDDDGLGDKIEYYNATTGQYGSGVIRTSGDTTGEYGDPDTICPYVNDDDSDDDGLQDGYEVGSDGVWEVTRYGNSTQDGIGETCACNPDTDNDGLLDGEEEGLFGQGFVNVVGDGWTSSTVPALDTDCDRDGLSDYEEVHVTMTNPLHWDTDGDSISDANELIATTAGTFPVFSETTNTDGVARTFYQESDPLDTDTDDDLLLDTVEYDGTRLGDPTSTYWLSDGGDPDTVCPYVNDDDSDDDGLQDGIEDADRDGAWDPLTTGNSATQKPQGETNLCDCDTDDDGLTDGEEVALFGGLPVDTSFPHYLHEVLTTAGDTIPALDDDSDNDGLSDYEEVNITGTDPLDADTDGDTISDANELIAISQGTTPLGFPIRTFDQESDPLDIDTDDDGLTDNIEWDGSGLGITRVPGGTRDLDCPYVNDDDSDHDGLQDGVEDANHDGVWGVKGDGPPTVGDFATQAAPASDDYYETNLCDCDTDGDGLLDGEEVALIGGGPVLGRPATWPANQPFPGFHTVTPEGVSTVLPLGTGPAGSPPGTGNSQLGPYTFIPIAGAAMTTDKTVPALDMDSDNDGLSDYEEVNITGTDPLDQDTDNDTLMDSDELIATGGGWPNRTFDQESDPLDINTDDDHLFDPQEYYNNAGQYGSGLGSSPLLGGLGGARDICPYVNDDDSDDDGLQDGLVVSVDPQTSLGYDYSYTHYEDFVDIQAYSGLGVDSPGYAKVTVSPATDYEQYDDTLQNVCDCDSDGDGLYDGEEVAIGTDPDDWDTDNDGRSDWHEHTGGGPIPTDPFDPDTDDDGLTDSVEVFGLNPTNPVNADTDGDGLCDGGTGTPWMTSGDDRVIVNPICKSCATPGLGDCGTGSVRTGSVDGIGDHPNPHGYGEDKDGDGTWDGSIGDLWADGEPGSPETDPNQYDTDGDAEGDGIEVLGFSTSRQSWIPTTDLFGRTINVTYPACGCLEPLIADTDGDGLSDGYEDNNHDGNFDFLPSDFDYAPDPLPGPPQPNPNETNPCDPDTDDDDLTDYEERYQSQVFVRYPDLTRSFNPTNPLDHDTDNDWLLDGEEVKWVCTEITYYNLDNDGDALIDEDWIDGLDNDGDGLIDEDPVDFFVRFVPMLDPTCRDSDSDGWIDGLDDDPCNSELIPLLPEVKIEPIDTDGDGFADDDEIVAGTHPNDPEDYPVAYYAIDLDFDQAIDDRLWLEPTLWSGIANSVAIDIDCNVLIDARVRIIAPRDVKQGDFDGDGAEDDYRYVVEYAFSNYRVVQPRIVLTIYDYNGDLVIDHAEVVRK